MTGLAQRPGTEVEPTCSVTMPFRPKALPIFSFSSSKIPFHAASYSSRTTFPDSADTGPTVTSLRYFSDVIARYGFRIGFTSGTIIDFPLQTVQKA